MKLLPLVVALACAACTLPPQPGRPTAQRLHNAAIDRDTVWHGAIVIDGSVKVFKGATLTIMPGSDIAFVPRDDDRDGLGDGTLIVEGSLRAVGTAAEPIVFRSAAPTPAPGDWLEIRVDFSREARLRYCEIRDSAHTLHAHFTRATLEDSHIHRNIDGCRLGQGDFTLQRNLIEENEGKGINFRNATVTIRNNIVRRNGSGIFLFESDRPPVIAGNNLYANGDNLRLGDFFHRDLSLGENWWGSADPAVVAAGIYDRAEDATLGTVTTEIAPAWLPNSGPRDRPLPVATGAYATEGFVDAPPLFLGDDLIVAGWDGALRRVDRAGAEIWRRHLGDVVDAPPVTDGERVYGQSWGREVFALAARDGRTLWSFVYPPSPADDHRQGGVVLSDGVLLVPAWNGTLYALDAASGALRWQFVTPGPLRAAPTVAGDRIYLPGGDGLLYALDRHGTLLWRWNGTAPLLSTAALADAGPVCLDRAGTVTALDRDGAVRWQRALGESCYYAAPLAAGRSLYVATAAGGLWHLDAAGGATIWRRDGFGPIYATPLLSGERLLVADNDGVLSVVGRHSGDLLATWRAGAAIQGLAASGGRLALGSRDRQVHLLTLHDAGIEP